MLFDIFMLIFNIVFALMHLATILAGSAHLFYYFAILAHAAAGGICAVYLLKKRT
jgi:hypothetical protein